MDPQQLRNTVASARKGKPDAYAALLEHYGLRLYGYFLRTTGNHHDAEDLLSEVMVRLVSRLESYDERGRFDQWLFRIAANVARDRLRRMKAAPASISLSAQGGGDRPLGNRLAGQSPAVDAAMLAGEMSKQLTAALDKLDETTRQMILLRHYGELSFNELAEVFQCPLGTALAKVHRGLRALRQHMEAFDELD